jgi:hypothetical protein
MDLNHQYSEHQQAVMRAAALPKGEGRYEHLGVAASIASAISDYQARLGAAAACAWSVASMRPSTAECRA